jgi:quercetin dioxygenase-like cupin family protein
MKLCLGICFALTTVSAAHSQDSPYRKELARSDLGGSNMEVVTSIVELKPGEGNTLHIHHGEESFYVLEGGVVELTDGRQVSYPTGKVGINHRDVPHGGYKVVGKDQIRILTTHVVDKGKPLYDAPPKQ